MNKRKNTTRKNSTNFRIYYDDVSVNGQQLTRLQTKNIPRIHFKSKKDKYYTIVIYDLHSPKPAYIHFLAINVTDPLVIRPTIEYQPPSPPPSDTHYHVYMIELYEQPGFLTIGSRSRIGFDPVMFSKMNKLYKIAQRGFYVNPKI